MLANESNSSPPTPDTKFIAWKKQKAKEMFEKMCIRINQRIDVKKFRKRYNIIEDRTLEFYIKGMEDVDTGFVFKDGRVRTIKKIADKPTVVFKCSEDVFLRMATKEITLAQAYFWGWIDVIGENALRDYEIFNEMFNEYGSEIFE